jgi:serine/threonine protein kinase
LGHGAEAQYPAGTLPSFDADPAHVPGDAELPRGTVVSGTYRIESTLGAGGMGVVYAATNLNTHESVALKWMHPHFAEDEEAAARFMREAGVIARIGHPNVVHVFHVGRDGNTPFLVMELLRGSSLADLLDGRPMQPGELVDVLIPAMRGVQAAHHRGIIHRDLKPANIFVCTDAAGRRRSSKVLDFGVSKALERIEGLASLTKSGAVLGTPQYMSPEQALGGRVDERTDVYALGVILYEGLTGQLPFSAKSFGALAIEITTGWLRPPRTLAPSIDPKLETVVMRALARERDVRFPNVTALAQALEPFAAKR